MKEKLSALLDDEGGDREQDGILAALGKDPELRGVWERYHLVRAAIRRELDFVCGPELAGRIADRLSDEPAIVAPRRWTSSAGMRARFTKAGAGLAIAATVAAVAIVSLQPFGPPDASPAVAVAGKAQSPRATEVAPPRAAQADQQRALSALLVHHSEFTPSAGMNGMMSYVRVVGRHNVPANNNSE